MNRGNVTTMLREFRGRPAADWKDLAQLHRLYSQINDPKVALLLCSCITIRFDGVKNRGFSHLIKF